MDNNSIIDRKTFEVCTHAEDHPNVFVCDKLIAPVVALLNKKGYKTVASCSGHYKVEFYEYFNKDLGRLEEFKNDKDIIIKDIRNDGFLYWEEVTATCTYILFDKKYSFETLPEGFILEEDGPNEDHPRTCIRHVIEFYDSGKKRSRADVLQEIVKYCTIMLKEWAESLSYLK